MITNLNFVTIVVTDQDTALDFWTNKLGFEKRTDYHFPGLARFVTVAPKDQVSPEMVLVLQDASTIQKPASGHTGFIFRTDDCRGDYAALQARGVNFTAEPTDMPFGIQAIFSDPDGNLFYLAEPRVRRGS